MKQLSFIILIPCFLFFSINEKHDIEFEEAPQLNQPCKLKKVFYNDTLVKEHHYNNRNKLTRIDFFEKGIIKAFFSLNYDEQNRISFSEKGYYLYYSAEYVEENEIEINPVVRQSSRSTYQYKKGYNNSKINTMKTYSGFSDNLKYKGRYQFTYNNKDQLIKIEEIHKKRRKKKLKKKFCYELEYDSDNVTKIKHSIIRDNKDTSIYSIEQREYDSNPTLQFNHNHFIIHPGVILKNNLTYYRRILPNDSPQNELEYKFIHEYDKNGLLIKSFRNTIKTWRKPSDYVITYEYTCE